jgi:hypothetical protein
MNLRLLRNPRRGVLHRDPVAVPPRHDAAIVSKAAFNVS